MQPSQKKQNTPFTTSGHGDRKLLKQGIALLLTAMSASVGVNAYAQQDYPNKPIRLIVPYPPGGSTDAISRIVGSRLSDRLKQTVVIENRGGATEQVAGAYVKNQPADGYTVMLTTMGGMTTNPWLYGDRLAYNPKKDFAPVILAVTMPSIVMVHPDIPATDITSLTRYFKDRKEPVNYASSGAGTASHLAMELYKRATGVEATHIPFRGGAPAMQALMAGDTQVMIAIGAESMPMAKAGKMKALAVTTKEQSPAFPELAPVAKTPGLEDFEMPYWYGYIVPAGTPKDIIAKLNKEFDEILHEPETSKKLVEMGVDITGGPPERLAAQIDSDTVRWGKVIKDAGITID